MCRSLQFANKTLFAMKVYFVTNKTVYAMNIHFIAYKTFFVTNIHIIHESHLQQRQITLYQKNLLIKIDYIR